MGFHQDETCLSKCNKDVRAEDREGRRKSDSHNNTEVHLTHEGFLMSLSDMNGSKCHHGSRNIIIKVLLPSLSKVRVISQLPVVLFMFLLALQVIKKDFSLVLKRMLQQSYKIS